MNLESGNIFQSESIIDKAEEQLRAINILIHQGYTIIDLEGFILNKWNIKTKKKPMLSPKRYNNRNTE